MLRSRISRCDDVQVPLPLLIGIKMVIIADEEMRNIIILKRNYFYLFVVGRVEFEEMIFTSWWFDKLREEQREGKTVGFPYDRL